MIIFIMIVIIVVIIIIWSTDLRSDGIFNANDTNASHLGDDLLFILPVRFDSHLNVVGTRRICTNNAAVAPVCHYRLIYQ